jgi:hypothetical protein
MIIGGVEMKLEILLRASELQKAIKQVDKKADLIEIVVRDGKLSILAKLKDKVKVSEKVDIIDGKDWNYTMAYSLFADIMEKVFRENPEFISFKFTDKMRVLAYIKNGDKLECVFET